MVCADMQRRLDIIDDVNGFCGNVLKGVDPSDGSFAIVLAAGDEGDCV